jgi:hypothetical protein
MPTNKPGIEKQQTIANKQRCTTIVEDLETSEDRAPRFPRYASDERRLV